MSYETRAYDNEHGDPVVVLVATAPRTRLSDNTQNDRSAAMTGKHLAVGPGKFEHDETRDQQVLMVLTACRERTSMWEATRNASQVTCSACKDARGLA